MKTINKYIKKNGNTGIFCASFPHIADMVSYIAGTKPIVNISIAKAKEVGGDKSFFMTETYEEAEKLALHGWHEMAKKISDQSKPLINKITKLIERERIAYDVEGNGIDVARYVEGIPECMTRYDTDIKEGKGKRIISIFVNTGASHSINTDIILARGIMTVTLVKVLEYAGFSTRILAASRGIANAPDKSVTVNCIVKTPGHPLDIGRAAFMLAHPSYHRRLTFAVRETLIKLQGGEYKTYEMATPSDYDIAIPSNNQFNKADINNTITSLLKSQGVKLK